MASSPVDLHEQLSEAVVEPEQDAGLSEYDAMQRLIKDLEHQNRALVASNAQLVRELNKSDSRLRAHLSSSSPSSSSWGAREQQHSRFSQFKRSVVDRPVSRAGAGATAHTPSYRARGNVHPEPQRRGNDVPGPSHKYGRYDRDEAGARGGGPQEWRPFQDPPLAYW